MLSFLPNNITNALNKVVINKVYEIRLRENKPIVINFDGKYVYLSDSGSTLFQGQALIADKQDIYQIINNVTEQSVYAFNDRLKNGYLTTKNGVRIGVAGECVFDCGNIVTVKNISSINIRIPHKVVGCASKLFNVVNEEGRIHNTLLIAPPTFGKTTMLKDLICTFDSKFIFPMMVIDERGELFDETTKNVDYIRYSDKLYAFKCGVRSLAPRIIFTDELVEEEDWKCVASAIDCGTEIIATCHGANINDVKSKRYFIDGVFSRYVLLDNRGRPGVINGVFDKGFNYL